MTKKKRVTERREFTERKSLSETTEWANVLYFGDPNTGKTTALASMANLGRVLFISAESGLKITPLRRLGIPTENIEIVDEIDFSTLEAELWRLREEFAQDPLVWAAVLIDSITEVEAQLLQETTQEAVRKAASRGIDRDPFVKELGDYGKNNDKMMQLIRGFRDLPCHVGFSALARRDQDDDDGTVRYGPALGPRVAERLVGHVDCSIAMQPILPRVAREGGPIYWGHTQRQGKWMGKDRFGVLPQPFPFPSFQRVLGYLSGEITKKTDPEVKSWREYIAAQQKEQ